MLNKYYVYIYINPKDSQPFYVGKGCGNRAWRHLKETKINTENYKKWCILENLRKLELEPIILILKDNLSEEDAYKLEKETIIKYGRRDLDKNGILTNVCIDQRPPSAKGRKQSLEQKETARIRMLENSYWKGKKKPPEMQKYINSCLPRGENHHMHGTNHYELWLIKYGAEIALEKKRKMIEKQTKSNEGKTHSEKSKELMRQVQKGLGKGRKWIYNPETFELKQEFPLEALKLISSGWEYGRPSELPKKKRINKEGKEQIILIDEPVPEGWKLGGTSKGRGENSKIYGRIAITDGINNKMISKSDIIPNGWVEGKTSSLKTKKIYINNGIICKRVEEGSDIPLGWFLGSLSRDKSNKKKFTINNGVREKRILLSSPIPIGWYKGCIKKLNQDG